MTFMYIWRPCPIPECRGRETVKVHTREDGLKDAHGACDTCGNQWHLDGVEGLQIFERLMSGKSVEEPEEGEDAPQRRRLDHQAGVSAAAPSEGS